VNSPPRPPFDSLLDLAQRDGVDIRPTLLRVITDGYMQNAVPTPEDQRQYAELAMRLLEETDIAARTAVAVRLARHPVAPPAIIQMLARDVLEVAEPILRHSSVLTPADCEAIKNECGPFYSEILAERGRAPAPSVMNIESPGSVSNADNNGAAELCELFYSADGSERRLILLNLDYAAPRLSKARIVPQRADIWRLEMAALRHQTEIVMRELENALGISNRQARRIINDELGEPIVAAAKAIDMPREVLQRVLLFLNPKVGQSVDRVYELATLYDEISTDAASGLIAIFREADAAEQTVSPHTPPTWRHAVEGARRALSEISRQPHPHGTRRNFNATG
jgi:hypothetical protein